MNWQPFIKWFKGLVGAVVGGAATAVTMMVIDPVTFNLAEGFPVLVKIALVAGVVNAAFYLKASPVPGY